MLGGDFICGDDVVNERRGSYEHEFRILKSELVLIKKSMSDPFSIARITVKLSESLLQSRVEI
jgi:hypothetical protein